MTAICTACGETRGWRATRGTRLSDLRCRCGGMLRTCRGDGAAIARIKRSGTVILRCVLDSTHRPRRYPGPYITRSPYPLAVEVGHSWRPLRLVLRGEPVCWLHDLEPVAYA